MNKVFSIVTGVFAIIGIIFVGVFFAIQFGLLNVRGLISERNQSIRSAQADTTPVSKKNTRDTNRAVMLCKIHTLANYAPQTAHAINQVYETAPTSELVQTMFSVASRRFNTLSFMNQLKDCETVTIPDTNPVLQTAFPWADSDEWAVMKSAFIRDQEYIRKAAADAGISPRILLGGIIGEQFRFFTNSRDSFKSYFEPLKLLASLSKFSFGIAGLKPETVARIDENLKNPDSVFYLGQSMENIIGYPDNIDPETVRFERITDTKNAYYSYLYAGLFMRQVTAQWRHAGYEIGDNPGVLATLYNLGFNRSVPKPIPQIGGAPITVNGTQYTFGDLAYEFYYSGELLQEFPYTVSK
jgi:hypothetical protein